MTFILIHGGGSTARFWDRVVPLLRGPALAVDLPGRNGRAADLATLSVEDEVASVVADVGAADIGDSITLVAHSSGGLVVPGVVAALGGQVRRIVLNAALVPMEAGRGIDCMSPRHRDGLLLAVEQAERGGTSITLPGPPEDPELLRRAYGGAPLSDADLAFVVDPVRNVPDTVHHYFQPVRWSQADGVPVTYVLNEADRPVSPAAQAEMATYLPGAPTVVRIDAGHLPAVTHPALLARLLTDG